MRGGDRGGEPAGPFVLAVGAQQRLAGEVGGAPEAAGDGGGAERGEWRLHQHHRLDAVPGAVAEADGEIEALAGEVDPVVVGEEAQVHFRVAGGEGGEAGEQPARRERADDADRQHFLEAAVGEALQRAADPVERLAQHRNERRAFVGEREAARQAAEQGDPQSRLQPLYLMADRRLADEQFEPRAGEAQMARGGFEGAQGIQGQVRPHRRSSIRFAYG